MTPRDVPVLCPPRDFNHKTLPAFEKIAEPHLAPGGAGIVLDLSGVEFVNSTGLGYLVRMGKDLGEQKRRMALAAPQKKVERLIRMIGLDEMLPLFKNVADAKRFVERSS